MDAPSPRLGRTPSSKSSGSGTTPSIRRSRQKEWSSKSKSGSEKSHSSSSNGRIRRRLSHTDSWEILEEPDKASAVVQAIVQRKQKLREAAGLSDKKNKKSKSKRTKSSSAQQSPVKLPPMTSTTRRELRKQKKEKSVEDEAETLRALYVSKESPQRKNDGSASSPSMKSPSNKGKIAKSKKSAPSNTNHTNPAAVIDPIHIRQQRSSVKSEKRRSSSTRVSADITPIPRRKSESRLRRKTTASSSSGNKVPSSPSKTKNPSLSKTFKRSGKKKSKKSTSSKSSSPEDPLLYPIFDESATSTTVDMDISHSWDMDNVLEIHEYPPPKETRKSQKKSSTKTKSSKGKTKSSSTKTRSSKKKKSKRDSPKRSTRHDPLLFSSSSNHSSASLKRLSERHAEIQEEDERMERAMDEIFYRQRGHSRDNDASQKIQSKDKNPKKKKESSCLLSSMRRKSRKSTRRSLSPGKQDEKDILDEYLQKQTIMDKQRHSEREWLARHAVRAADQGYSLDFRTLPPHSPGSVYPQRRKSRGAVVVLP